MEKLIRNIANYSNLNKQIESDISNLFTKNTYAKGEFILEANKKCNKLYYINSGSVRTYYLHEGKDITSWIYPEDSFITTWAAFYNNTLSFENIQAIAPCEIYSITKYNLEGLYSKYHEMEIFGRKFAEEQLAFIDEISHEFMFIDAKQRYEKLLEFFPDITRIANLGHIASILGINQVTLSRIRKIR